MIAFLETTEEPDMDPLQIFITVVVGVVLLGLALLALCFAFLIDAFILMLIGGLLRIGRMLPTNSDRDRPGRLTADPGSRRRTDDRED